ncbi:MAG: hypothetical protein GEV03_26760 [Streptosporangiales bacterium]|nr:hypothetical protein [Streptosporangiales bacterium]
MTDEGQVTAPAPRPTMPRRIAPALGLFLLAPLTAEYLIGYDDKVGRPVELLAGLLILAPLYGGPALIIREVARRTGRGWPTMILLAAAFGLFQAGLVDESLFNASYRDIEYWDEMLNPTFIPALGIGADMVVGFVIGHVIWSIGMPIAIVETFVTGRGTRPWLGVVGLTFTGVLYVAASALIFYDHQQTERFLASAPQLIGTAAAVVALIVAAFAVGRRPRPAIDRPAPNPWPVGAAALTAASLFTLAPPNWPGVAAKIALLAVVAAAVTRLSRRSGWGAAHRLALAGGALLSHAWVAFTVEPLGDPAIFAKLSHNTVFALGAVALLAAAVRALRGTRGPV